MSRFEKIKNLKVGDYLRELSIVIIGVAITLYAGNIIGDRKEQKDLNLQLTAVYAELEENLVNVDSIKRYYDDSFQLRKYLIESFKNPHFKNNDSIRKYERVASFISTFYYKKGAYEMFVNSGAMKLLSDREQLLNITESYAMLEALKDGSESYADSKMQVMQSVYHKDTPTAFNSDIMDPRYNFMFNFQALTSGMENSANEVRIQIEKTLSYNRN